MEHDGSGVHPPSGGSKRAAISYHDPHLEHAHELFARLSATLGRENVFFVDYERGRKHIGVEPKLADAFSTADVVVVLLSGDHLESGTWCNLEWNEVIKRGDDDSRWDAILMEDVTLPRGIEIDSIRRRPVRQLAADVLDRLAVGRSSAQPGSLRDQILKNHQLTGTTQSVCCLVVAGTLVRAHAKTCRRIVVTRHLQDVADDAANVRDAKPRDRSLRRTELLFTLGELLKVFVDDTDRDYVRNAFFEESFLVVRLETYLRRHLGSQVKHIEIFCDQIAALLARSRRLGRSTRLSDLSDERLTEQIGVFAHLFALDLLAIESLPAIELSPSAGSVQDAMASYTERVTVDQKLMRTRLP